MKTKELKRFLRTNNIWVFLTSVLFFTWSCWFIAAVCDDLRTVFHYLGGAIPLIITIFFLIFRSNKSYRKNFLARIIDLRRIAPRYLLGIFLVVPIAYFLSGVLAWLLNGNLLVFDRFHELSLQPTSFLFFAFYIFIFGPLPEELAWRGFALDSLLNKYDWKIANLILALYWGIWHIPLFFIPGTYQNNLGFLTPLFWLFISSIIAQSFFIGWIFNNTNRSTLSAILIHFFINLFGELFDLSLIGEIYLSIFWWILVFTIFIYEAMRSRRVLNDQESMQQ